MVSSYQLLSEAAIVGAALALALAGATAVVRVNTWQTSLAVGFVLGAALHLLFELSGLNAVYCRVGNACAA